MSASALMGTAVADSPCACWLMGTNTGFREKKRAARIQERSAKATSLGFSLLQMASAALSHLSTTDTLALHTSNQGDASIITENILDHGLFCIPGFLQQVFACQLVL